MDDTLAQSITRPIGQSIIEQICRSGDFTNHRRLANELENSLQNYFSCSSAVIVGNESLAIVMALASLNMSGRVGLSASCPNFIYNSIVWANLEPSVYDSSDDNCTVAISHIEQSDKSGTPLSAILLCDNWGAEDLKPVIELANKKGIEIVIYQCGYLANYKNSQLLYEGPRSVTVASIGPNSHTATNNCACIFTDKDTLAEKYRNIRSSYGARKTVNVKATANGRVSEYQAGLALNFLNNFESYKAHNIQLNESYNQAIRHIESINGIKYSSGVTSDFSSYVFTIDKENHELKRIQEELSRLTLLSLWNAGFSVADMERQPKSYSFLQRSFILPMGTSMPLEKANAITQEVLKIFGHKH